MRCVQQLLCQQSTQFEIASMPLNGNGFKQAMCFVACLAHQFSLLSMHEMCRKTVLFVLAAGTKASLHCTETHSTFSLLVVSPRHGGITNVGDGAGFQPHSHLFCVPLRPWRELVGRWMLTTSLWLLHSPMQHNCLTFRWESVFSIWTLCCCANPMSL